MLPMFRSAISSLFKSEKDLNSNKNDDYISRMIYQTCRENSTILHIGEYNSEIYDKVNKVIHLNQQFIFKPENFSNPIFKKSNTINYDSNESLIKTIERHIPSKPRLISIDSKGDELNTLKSLENYIVKDNIPICITFNPELALKFGYGPKELFKYIESINANIITVRKFVLHEAPYSADSFEKAYSIYEEQIFMIY